MGVPIEDTFTSIKKLIKYLRSFPPSTACEKLATVQQNDAFLKTLPKEHCHKIYYNMLPVESFQAKFDFDCKKDYLVMIHKEFTNYAKCFEKADCSQCEARAALKKVDS